MTKYSHQHPFTALRIAMTFLAVYGCAFAIVGAVIGGYREVSTSGFGSSSDTYYYSRSISPIVFYTVLALTFLVDFILSLIDVLATPHPRRFDAVADGIVGAGYLAFYLLEVIIFLATWVQLPALLACTLHIFMCIKNANPNNRVHWTRDGTRPGPETLRHKPNRSYP